MKIQQYRGRLSRTLDALQKGQLTVGFAGGSITDPRPECNWPDPVIAWLVETFPQVRIHVENTAIGATGSDLAAFRAESSLIERGCDLVFVEFAVNDQQEKTERRMRTREGLLRKLLAGEGRDVVLTYTYFQPMYVEMMEGKVPATIAEFEQLAEHYRIGSVWMGYHALQEVMKGRMRWEEWLPDGLHPQNRGSLSYAQSVIAYLEKELVTSPSDESIPVGHQMPAPLSPDNWEGAYILPFDRVRLEGPWTIRNWPKLPWVEHVLHTAAVGAKLSFDFTGSGLVLGFDFGSTSGEFRYRLDGGEWQVSTRDRPEWAPADGGWYRLFPVDEALEPGNHTFELEVVHGDTEAVFKPEKRCMGTNMRLALIGVLP